MQLRQPLAEQFACAIAIDRGDQRLVEFGTAVAAQRDQLRQRQAHPGTGQFLLWHQHHAQPAELHDARALPDRIGIAQLGLEHVEARQRARRGLKGGLLAVGRADPCSQICANWVSTLCSMN